MSETNDTSIPTTDIRVWFPKLPHDVQTQLRTNPNAALNLEAIDAITRAGGVGPATANFVEARPAEPRWHLSYQQRTWLAQLTEPDADERDER